jgi:hypothetical protein
MLGYGVRPWRSMFIYNLNLLERAETEIGFSIANGTFKMKMDINRHGPRSLPSNCKNLNPPNFSLPTTFKSKHLVTLSLKTLREIL